MDKASSKKEVFDLGCWMIAKDRIKVTPKVDDALIREFIEFSIISCPQEYCTEKFSNCWFFDSENRLVSGSGKFAEPSVWYRHLKKYFFEPRGYEVPDQDEITFLGEGEPGMWELEEERAQEYKEWLKRKEKFMDYIPDYGSLYSFNKRQSGIPPLPAGMWPKYWNNEANE